ncbi:MAG: right-handed parallel beta-helix repeat-containing protein [Candidatus Binatia bacterium]
MTRETLSNQRVAVLTLLISIVLVHDIGRSALARTATFYVGKDGHNDNSCSDAQSRPTAKLTINEGLKCLTAGDTLYIGAGTYEEAISSEDSVIPVGTSWNDVVTIAAYPGESVTLKPSGVYAVIRLVHSYICYLVFDGLIIDAANTSADGVSMMHGAHHVRFQNGEIKNAPTQGIIITNNTGSTSFNEFINLKVHNNGTNKLHHGAYISTSNNLIEKSEFYSNSGYGIHLYDEPGGTVNNNIVRSNVTRDNGFSSCCTAGILAGSGNDNLVYNNISYRNKYGITIGYNNATNTKIYNNTVYNNLEYGIRIRTTSVDAIIKNNIVYRNATPIYDLGTNTTLSHNLTSDPQFVDAETLNFLLQPGSPAIDSGEVLKDVTVDFRGVSRAAGTGPDVGAYEFADSHFSSISAAPSDLQVQPTEDPGPIE